VSKSSVVLGVSLAALFCSLVVTVAFSQATDSLYEFERGFPAAGTTERAYDAADLRRAIEAYKFFYPRREYDRLQLESDHGGYRPGFE
jgi:hypothetical protein